MEDGRFHILMMMDKMDKSKTSSQNCITCECCTSTVRVHVGASIDEVTFEYD